VNVKFCSVVLKIEAKSMDICKMLFEDDTMCMSGEALSYLAKTWTKLKVGCVLSIILMLTLII